MRRIAYLTDAELLGTPGLSDAKPRLTARAVVVAPDNRIAVMYAARYGIHTLPGGGVEEGESVAEALVREVTEETGCRIASFEPLGYVEENRFHADYTQLSYYFVVRARDGALQPHLTDLEAANDTSIMWCTAEESFDRISGPVFDRPQGKFLQARDVAALRAYMYQQEVTVTRIMPDNPDLRHALADYAQNCSWVAGPHIAGMLRENRFTGWETAFAAIRNGRIIGYCTFLRTDYYPENRYWPWISSIFVDEEHRGRGVCGMLIGAAIRHAQQCGFRRVYIPSDMTGFYERYGFERIDELRNYGGDIDHIFARDV